MKQFKSFFCAINFNTFSKSSGDVFCLFNFFSNLSADIFNRLLSVFDLFFKQHVFALYKTGPSYDDHGNQCDDYGE